DGNVQVIDTGTNTVVATVAVGSQPRAIAVTPNGLYAYVANFGSNSVTVIDLTTNSVVTVPDGSAISVGTNPQGAVVTPDGSRVYVSNRGDNNVIVIDTATNTVVPSMTVGVGT